MKTSIYGLSVNDPTVYVSDTRETFEEIVTRCLGNRVIVNGNFERSEFYLPHREKLVQLFDFPSLPTQGDEVVFHFRGSNFIGSDLEVPLSFYLQVWNDLGRPSKKIAVTDDRNYSIVRAFCHESGAVLRNENVLADFGFLVAAKKLVISKSTFAWWAAFLSNADIVYPISRLSDRKRSRGFRDLSNPDWKSFYVDI